MKSLALIAVAAVGCAALSCSGSGKNMTGQGGTTGVAGDGGGGSGSGGTTGVAGSGPGAAGVTGNAGATGVAGTGGMTTGAAGAPGGRGGPRRPAGAAAPRRRAPAEPRRSPTPAAARRCRRPDTTSRRECARARSRPAKAALRQIVFSSNGDLWGVNRRAGQIKRFRDAQRRRHLPDRRDRQLGHDRRQRPQRAHRRGGRLPLLGHDGRRAALGVVEHDRLGRHRPGRVDRPARHRRPRRSTRSTCGTAGCTCSPARRAT